MRVARTMIRFRFPVPACLLASMFYRHQCRTNMLQRIYTESRVDMFCVLGCRIYALWLGDKQSCRPEYGRYHVERERGANAKHHEHLAIVLSTFFPTVAAAFPFASRGQDLPALQDLDAVSTWRPRPVCMLSRCCPMLHPCGRFHSFTCSTSSILA